VGRGLRDSDVGTWDVGLEDSGTRGRGVAGTLGRGDVGTWDASTRGDSRTWDVRTGGYDKQTSPDFCAEVVKYNFRRSTEK